MLDLNALRVFERVADLRSFAAAARSLGMPKSSVSRAVARLEAELATRLLQRSTREVTPTQAGEAVRERCRDILGSVAEARDYLASMGAAPRGKLKVTSGVGFGINILSDVLATFVDRYPDVDVTLDLTSRHEDLIAESVDVAVRLGPMEDSGLVTTRLGTMRRYLCAAPAYLERRPVPRSIDDLNEMDAIEMPAPDGRNRSWTFTRGERTVKVDPRIRICVNEALTIHRLVVRGAGAGIISGYLCAPDIAAGRLVQLLPDWAPPPVDVSLVFPSRSEVAPSVRAFADLMKAASVPGAAWLDDPL